jgi:hypothetical protein
MAAVGTVTLALLFYTIGTVQEQRTRRATGPARGFLTAGLACDLVATALMIAATGSFSPTLHGWLGYSALAMMLVDVILIWRHALRRPGDEVPAGQHLYARLAYLYWVVAYVAGAVLVMAGRSPRH